MVGGVELIHHRLRRHSIPQRSAEGWIRDVAGSSMNRTRKYHPDHRVTSLHPTLSSSTLSLHRPSDSSICLLLVHAACLLHHPFNHSSTIRPMSTYDMAVSHSHNHPYPALSSHTIHRRHHPRHHHRHCWMGSSRRDGNLMCLEVCVVTVIPVWQFPT